MGVLSDDFAAVDIREELCYHSRPEKAKFKRHMGRERKPNKKELRGGKSGSRSPSGSAGTAPRRRAFRFSFPVLFWLSFAWRVLGCGGAKRRRTRLCLAHATVPKCLFSYYDQPYFYPIRN